LSRIIIIIIIISWCYCDTTN